MAVIQPGNFSTRYMCIKPVSQQHICQLTWDFLTALSPYWINPWSFFLAKDLLVVELLKDIK